MKLQRAPLVCNGCQTSQNCYFSRFYYDAKRAKTDYEISLSESREGINMNEDEFVKLSNIICPLVENKQSIASQHSRDHKEIGCLARSIYCVASSIRAMPENEKTPAMRVDIYA